MKLLSAQPKVTSRVTYLHDIGRMPAAWKVWIELLTVSLPPNA